MDFCGRHSHSSHHCSLSGIRFAPARRGGGGGGATRVVGRNAMIGAHGQFARSACQQQHPLLASPSAAPLPATLRRTLLVATATHMRCQRLAGRLLCACQLHHAVALRTLGRLHTGQLVPAPVLHARCQLQRRLGQRFKTSPNSAQPCKWCTQRAADPRRDTRPPRSVGLAAPAASPRP